jgi:hypothetical protein
VAQRTKALPEAAFASSVPGPWASFKSHSLPEVYSERGAGAGLHPRSRLWPAGTLCVCMCVYVCVHVGDLRTVLTPPPPLFAVRQGTAGLSCNELSVGQPIPVRRCVGQQQQRWRRRWRGPPTALSHALEAGSARWQQALSGGRSGAGAGSCDAGGAGCTTVSIHQQRQLGGASPASRSVLRLLRCPPPPQKALGMDFCTAGVCFWRVVMRATCSQRWWMLSGFVPVGGEG